MDYHEMSSIAMRHCLYVELRKVEMSMKGQDRNVATQNRRVDGQAWGECSDF